MQLVCVDNRETVEQSYDSMWCRVVGVVFGAIETSERILSDDAMLDTFVIPNPSPP